MKTGLELVNLIIIKTKKRIKSSVIQQLMKINALFQLKIKFFQRKSNKILFEDLSLVKRRLRAIDLIFTLKSKFNNYLYKKFLMRLLKDYLDNYINDPRKHILFNLLEEGFEFKHLPLFFNNIDYFSKCINNNYSIQNKEIIKEYIRNISLEENNNIQRKAELSYYNKENNIYIRNIYSFKWWDNYKTTFSQGDYLEKAHYYESIDNVKSEMNPNKNKQFFEYIRYFISNLKSGDNEECKNCKSNKNLTCEICQGKKEFSSSDLKFKHEISLFDFKKKMLGFSNNQIENKINNININPESNRLLKFSMKKKEDTLVEDKNKFDINSVFSKIEKTKNTGKGFLNGILSDIEENSKK